MKKLFRMFLEWAAKPDVIILVKSLLWCTTVGIEQVWYFSKRSYCYAVQPLINKCYLAFGLLFKGTNYHSYMNFMGTLIKRFLAWAWDFTKRGYSGESLLFPMLIGLIFYIVRIATKEAVECDAPESWQLLVQDPATPSVEGMIFFYNYLMLFIIVIGILVCYMLYIIIFQFKKENKTQIAIFTHSSVLEIVWTFLPAVILGMIAVPSFKLLYSLDDFSNPNMTLKIIGHQWYWSYELSDYADKNYIGILGYNFDSYMISSNDLTFGSFRLLEVDNRVILPIQNHIRLLVTAADVLHSWAVPSFGIKVDACPGRLSQASLYVKREGVFYGQCSEICGINHGFMPIVVKTVNQQLFIFWNAIKTEFIFKDNS